MNILLRNIPFMLSILAIYFIFLIIVRYSDISNIKKSTELEMENKEREIEPCDNILEQDYQIKMYLKSYNITGKIAYLLYKLLNK